MAGKKKGKLSAATATDGAVEELDNGIGFVKNDESIPETYVQEGASHKKKEKRKKRAAPEMDSTVENEVNAEHDIDKMKTEGLPINAEDDPYELTMEEKLASLELVNENKEVSAVEEPSAPVKPPSADSVHVLLKQALHADDHSLLLECLYNNDQQVITKSISLLSPADVLKLLKSLTRMVQTRGGVLVCVLPWLRCLLSQKASIIVSQETSLQLLNSLYQLVDARTSTLKPARELLSSLDFLFPVVLDDEEDEEETDAPIIYEDKDTDEDEEDSEGSDVMDTDAEGEDEELGDVIDAQFSDGSGIMSD